MFGLEPHRYSRLRGPNYATTERAFSYIVFISCTCYVTVRACLGAMIILLGRTTMRSSLVRIVWSISNWLFRPADNFDIASSLRTCRARHWEADRISRVQTLPVLYCWASWSEPNVFSSSSLWPGWRNTSTYRLSQTRRRLIGGPIGRIRSYVNDLLKLYSVFFSTANHRFSGGLTFTKESPLKQVNHLMSAKISMSQPARGETSYELG